jgi:HK97 gp10 family phage protein
MADNFQVRLEGVEDLKRALADLTDKLKKRVLVNALRAAARVIQREAKAAAPVLQMPTKYRKSGTVRDRIRVRVSKFARQAGDVGVFLSVKPIRGKAETTKLGRRSARNPNDPYYWRFLEFGTVKMAARPFLSPAASRKGNEAIATFMRSVVPQIERLNRSKP